MSNIQIVEQQIESAKVDFEANVEELKLNLNFKKEAAFAMQIFQGNTYLQKMEPNSVRNAIVNVALTGLSLNPVLRYAYLIPRKGKCILDISYIGLVKVLTDTGSVKNIEANIVYWNEPFKLERGTNPSIHHGTIDQEGVKKGNIRGAYSVATLNDGSKSIEWMDADELMAIMARSESVKSGNNSPWKTDTTEMCRKTVIKRHYKYLPKSERALTIATAIDIDHENNGIDFEAERQEAQKETVNIQTLDPNDTATLKKYQEMIGAVEDPRVPEDAFGPTITKREYIQNFENEFMAGKMSVQLAEKVYNLMISFFQ